MPLDAVCGSRPLGSALQAVFARANLGKYFLLTCYLLGQLGGRLGDSSGGIRRGGGADGASSRARRCVAVRVRARVRGRARRRSVAAGEALRGRARRGTARPDPACPASTSLRARSAMLAP